MTTETAPRATTTAAPCPYRRGGDRCPYGAGLARGDIILVGTGGDDPDGALAKILARCRNADAPAPEWPTAHTAGEVTRVRAGRVVEYRDGDGIRHPVKVGPGAVTLYRYAHRETLRGSLPATVAAVAAAGNWLAAEVRLLDLIEPNRGRCEHTA